MRKNQNKFLFTLEKGFIFIISEIILILGIIGVLYFLIMQNSKIALDLAIITGIFIWINKTVRKLKEE